MNCTIPAQNTKVLSKAINSLAKIGDEIYLEAYKDKLRLVTFNMSKTVCSQCHFFDSFFSSYDVEITEADEDKVTCKLFMKSILPLVKGNLEKKLEYLKIEYDQNSEFIVFKMKYKFDQVLMVHKLRLMEPETLSIGIKPNSARNNLCANSSFFNQFLTMFNLSDSEITFEFSNSTLTARNFYPGGPSNPNLIRCEVKLGAGEFLVYDVRNDTSINFVLKPLRILISFAEIFNLHVSLNFDCGGKPLTITLKNPTFEIDYLVSTLNPHKDIQSTYASTSLVTTTQKNCKNSNITIEDQLALETENWDVEMVVKEPEKLTHTKKSRESSSSRMPRDDNSDSNTDSPLSKKGRLVFSRCCEPTVLLIPKIDDGVYTISQQDEMQY